MQTVIIITEKELADLKHNLVNDIHEFARQPYGFKIVSRDTGDEITDTDQVHGMLFSPIARAFSRAGVERCYNVKEE